MTTFADRVDPARAREANRQQAEYYRGVLSKQRAVVGEQLANDELNLALQRNAGGLRKIKRLKREIRRKQTERNALDRFIAALEQRLNPGVQG